MKKAISILLALCLVLLSGTPVFAETQQTPVTADVTFGFTVSIPASITLTYGDTSASSYDLTASDVSILINTQVEVTAAGSGAGNAFTITNGTDTVPFNLSTTSGGSAINPGDKIAAFTADGTSPFWIKAPSWSAVHTAGTYAGNIVFTIGVADESYALTYDANGGTGYPPFDNTAYADGTEATAAAAGVMTRSGYTFVGWNTKADGSGDFYAAGDPVTMNGNTTLYAMWSGDGSSAASPILVYDYASLDAARGHLDADIIAVADIDAGSAWVPIANGSSAANQFTGAFDGKGHTVNIGGIGTVTPDSTGRSDDGLFGVLGGGGLIQNVQVSGLIRATGNVGGVLGCNLGGTVQNCVATADVVSGVSTNGGGVVGFNSAGTIQNCYASGVINNMGGTSFTFTYAGGIAGQNSGTVAHCYSTGSVMAFNMNCNVYAGGIVGENGGGISGCVALSTAVSGTEWNGNQTLGINQGRIAGHNSGGTLTGNSAINIPNATDDADADITTAQATAQAAYNTAGFSFGTGGASPWVWGALADYPLPTLYWQTVSPSVRGTVFSPDWTAHPFTASFNIGNCTVTFSNPVDPATTSIGIGAFGMQGSMTALDNAPATLSATAPGIAIIANTFRDTYGNPLSGPFYWMLTSGTLTSIHLQY